MNIYCTTHIQLGYNYVVLTFYWGKHKIVVHERAKILQRYYVHVLQLGYQKHDKLIRKGSKFESL